MSNKWTENDIPDQSGRVAVVTGANSGLGLETARALAAKGATVVMACRDTEKGERAAAGIRSADPGADVSVEALDLASLASVRAFAERAKTAHPEINLLVNNAGVMAPPRGTTEDGFERQFGTNHLGHFALTGLLLGSLAHASDPRVVTLSSGAHRIGSITFDDLQREHGYSRWRAYGQSKLANLLFALELDRRLREAGSPIKSLAAHPGYSATNLQFAAAPMLDQLVMRVANLVIAQSARMGVLPQLMAATAPDVESGQFVGPDGMGEQRGYPHVVSPHNREAFDPDIARRLWEVSEELTGVTYDLKAKEATNV